LGYLYQCRYALLLALQHDDDPSLQISIEKLDDVAFLTDTESDIEPTEVLQFKHHINRAGGLSDKSPDIWKTLRIWTEHILTKKVDLDRTVFLMVTTSSSTKAHAVHRLLDDPSVRDPKEALRLLEEAGKDSKAKDVCDAFAAFMSLSASQRRKMFERVHLLAHSPDALAVHKELETALRHAARPQHRTAFVERLEAGGSAWSSSILCLQLLRQRYQSALSISEYTIFENNFSEMPCQMTSCRLLFPLKLFATMTSECSFGNFTWFRW
jgi:hypothetical protein